MTLLDPPTPPLVATPPAPALLPARSHYGTIYNVGTKDPISHITSEHFTVYLRATRIQRTQTDVINEALDGIRINLLFVVEKRNCFRVKEEE